MKTKFILIFTFFLVCTNSLTAQEAAIEDNRKSNIIEYTPSKLLFKNQWDIKWFNNLYTQTRAADENGDVTKNLPRQTFFTSTLEVFTGVSDTRRVNIGTIVRFRSNAVGGRNTFDVFQFDGDSNTARSGITAIAPSVKIAPFKKLSNLSVQSSLFIPLIDREVENGVFFEQKGFVWQNRFFYDYTFPGNKFQLFTELTTDFNFGNKVRFDDSFLNTEEGSFANNSLVLFPGVFFSYFPSDKFTVLSLVQHFQRFDLGNNFEQDFTAVGGGLKYQLTEVLNVEALYTNFVRGTNNGLGETFNIGLRAIF